MADPIVYNPHMITILRNAYQKLDGMPLGFGIPAYSSSITDEQVYNYFNIDYLDTTRELQITIDGIEVGSITELRIENRIMYHALCRYRRSASIFFKFSSAVDGKSVDKTKIAEMISMSINDLDKEFRSWRAGSVGSLWNRSVV